MGKTIRVKLDKTEKVSSKRRAELSAIIDGDINYSDIPDMSQNENFWANTVIQAPKTKTPVTIRLDTDVLDWFKDQGKGYQTKINAVLKTYYEAHKDT